MATDRIRQYLSVSGFRTVLPTLAGGLGVVLLGPLLYLAEPELFGPANVILLVAVLVVAPLVLALIVTPDSDGRQPFIFRAARLAWPIAAAGTAISFLFPPGRQAAILAAPWLLFGALTAGCGVLRLYRRKGARLRIADLCMDIGLVYLLFTTSRCLPSRLRAPSCLPGAYLRRPC